MSMEDYPTKMGSPLVSILLIVRNGLPCLREAVASVARQSYRNYELIVQDGASTDGSLEFLRQGGHIPRLEIESLPDAGIGQACNRAMARSRGDIIGTLACDDMLEPDALEIAVGEFEKHPEAAAIYGSVKMTEAKGQVIRSYEVDSFDLFRFMRCESLPPMAAMFFSKKVCGEALRFDESMKTCSDYDLLLRLGHLPFVKVKACLARVRVSEKSQTCRPEMYEQFTSDKIAALERYLAQYELGPGVATDEMRRQGVAGIYAWAAGSMLWIPGGREHFEYWFQKARDLVPSSPRLRDLEFLGRTGKWGMRCLGLRDGLQRGLERVRKGLFLCLRAEKS
jgi:glycosyltransferase